MAHAKNHLGDALLRPDAQGREISRIILLFGGVALHQCNKCVQLTPGWALWWVWLRLCIGFNAAFFGYWIFMVHDKYSTHWNICVNLPLLFASVVTGSAWWWIPSRLASLDACRPGARERAERLTLKFGATLVSIIVLNIVVALCRPHTAYDLAALMIAAHGTFPVLAAVFFVLAVDTTHATQIVRDLIEEAKTRTLTIQRYVEARDAISQRSKKSRFTVGSLAAVSLWCSLAVLYLLYAPQFFRKLDNSTGVLGSLLYDGFYVTLMFKETALLFSFSFLVMDVNDAADSMTSVLIEHSWEDVELVDTKEDLTGRRRRSHVERLSLALLTMAYAPRPENLASLAHYLTTSPLRPITFELATVRVTRSLFFASMTSLGIACVSLVTSNVVSGLL